MEFATMVSGYSMLKDLKSIWDGLDASNQEKLDAVVCRAAERFLPEDNDTVRPVREHLLTKEVPFVERISMAALHPGTRKYLAERKAKREDASGVPGKMMLADIPPDIMVKCNNCGFSKAIHLHDEDTILDDKMVP